MKKIRDLKQAGQVSHIYVKDTSTENQQSIVLSALRESPKTTIELRHDYGVMTPAARVKELRENGHRIDTVRITSFTPDGLKHSKVAKYVLRRVDHE